MVRLAWSEKRRPPHPVAKRTIEPRKWKKDLDEAAAIRVSLVPALQGNLGFGQKKSVHFAIVVDLSLSTCATGSILLMVLLARAKMGRLF